MSADENWSEALEDLVENGDVDGAISLLESVVAKLRTQIVSSREEDAHLQLATALGELADLHSSNGFSLKADDLRSQSLLIRALILHPQLSDSGSFGEKVVRKHESGNEIFSNECQEEEEDDWETIADLETSLDEFSLSGQPEKGAVSGPSNVVVPSASPRRRGRGTFLYRKNELYSDQVEDEAFVDDNSSSVDEDASFNSLQDEDGAVINQRYGTSHVIVLYDFPPTTRTTQLEKLFDTFRDGGVAIRWVSDSVALAVFQTPSAALKAMTSIEFPFKVRRLEEKDITLLNIFLKDLEPPLVRPKTSVRTAQRLISHAMGIEQPGGRSISGRSSSDEFRKQEAARKNRILERQNMKNDAWGPE